MSDAITETSIEIMGKTYQIKCPLLEVDSLQQAAHYLDQKMRDFREGQILSPDRLAVITALNIVHQMFGIEQQCKQQVDDINNRLSQLDIRMNDALHNVPTPK